MVFVMFSGLHQLKAQQIPARTLKHFCYLAATFLPGIKVLRWPDPEHPYKDSCYSARVYTAHFSYCAFIKVILCLGNK